MKHYKVMENDGKKSRAVFMEIKAITRAVEKNGNEGKTMFDLNITHEVTEYFIKGNLVFEIERDLTRSVITTRLHYNGKEHKEIMLADVINLA